MSFFSSLTNRIFVATAALAVFAIAFAVYLVSIRAVRDAEAELRRGLVEAGRLVAQHRTRLLDTLATEANLIADLPKLKAAVDTADPPTIAPIAADYQSRVATMLFVVTDAGGRVLAADGARLAPLEVVHLPGVERALSGASSDNLWPLPGAVLQVVTVPIAIGPELLGTLSIGFPIDDALAQEFKTLTDSEVAFLMGDDVLATTVGGSELAALAAAADTRGIGRVALGGDDYAALVQPLGPEVRAMVLRSRSARLGFLSGLFARVGGLALLAVALAVGLSYGVARTVTRPLAAITEAMREMATTGDLTRKIRLSRRGRWEDEDASLLATTFNTLIDSIGRFQREAGQRDRLSSLGRLSTVVAHEIRNPLMIIKASLRTLRRDAVTPDEAREVAADIDEEVARLNRVVNDVLDFAKPMHFDLAPVDLGRLCRDCADATTADGQAPSVRTEVDPATGTIVTDAERLRVALVNLLANARQAVGARAAEGDAAPVSLPAVELRAGRGGDGLVWIEVADRGVGIAEGDLSRIFDPYFTTSRTGTGLGLAITKNIIDGLGGTIAVDSQPGRGTDIRVELPRGAER